MAVIDDHFLASGDFQLMDCAVTFGEQHAATAGFEYEKAFTAK